MKVNGKSYKITVKDYLDEKEYVPAHIVVELNEEILPKNMYEKTYLKDDNCLETFKI
ncbi:sulfur carrier protein ThiS [Eubacterium sp. AF34-35BH]|uniref:sulfur carrier protein ThiS n=1 Tax=Eubacterium TaxID=1730 RepID=UPI000E555BBA|nr:sulfur carrier protein ThiS [Eubacterium sp. AF34-35BH]RHP20093.1 sulfur carrier protein ThiS [Eubacterium sp. AF34-35BH]